MQRFVEHETRITSMHLEVARLQETLMYFTPIITNIQKEQMDRMQKFAEIRERLLILEQRIAGFEDRFDTQSKRILSLAERLDTLAVLPIIP